jgi:hypothetical protein
MADTLNICPRFNSSLLLMSVTCASNACPSQVFTYFSNKVCTPYKSWRSLLRLTFTLCECFCLFLSSHIYEGHSNENWKIYINSERYSDMLQNHLKPAIWRKCHDLLSSGMCLQHDNAQLHTARHTMKHGGVTPSAIFTRFGTQKFSPPLALKTHTVWTSLQVR